ncbi:hypothetical protein ACHAXT_001675 [Thalassiosira profunda]
MDPADPFQGSGGDGKLAAYLRRKERHSTSSGGQRARQPAERGPVAPLAGQRRRPYGGGSPGNNYGSSGGSNYGGGSPGEGSQASRRKHDQYAHVVDEVRGRGTGNSGGCNSGQPRRGQQQQSRGQSQQSGQEQQQWGFNADFDGGFGDGGFGQSSFQSPQQPGQRRLAPPRSSGGRGRHNASPASNNCSSAPNNYSSAQSNCSSGAQTGIPTGGTPNGRPAPRPGRSRLYQDPHDLSAKQRSRSTVRRTADRTQRLATAYKDAKRRQRENGSGEGGSGGWDDGMSDAGSVASFGGSEFGGYGSSFGHSFGSSGGGGGGGGLYGGRSHSGEDAFAGTSPFAMQQHAGQGGARRPNQSLNSFMARQQQTTSRRDDEGGSAASGAGSVAARRRAARRGTPTGSPPAHNKSPVPSAAPRRSPPPSAGNSVASGGSTAGTARSRMRARMQASPRGPLGGGLGSPGASDSGNGGSGAPAKPHPNGGGAGHSPPRHHPKTATGANASTARAPSTPDYGAMDLSSDAIDREVNLALSELHIEGVRIDFGTFGRLDGSSAGSHGGGSGSVGTGSVESSTVGSANRPPGVPAPFQNAGIGNGGGKGWKGGRGTAHSGARSPHTASTRSLTVDHASLPSRDAPPLPSASEPTLQTPGQAPGLAPVISVERGSESSSLTDDIHSNGAGELQVGGGFPHGGNRFKGADFHRAKKIVRPGEGAPRGHKRASSRQPASAEAAAEEIGGESAPSASVRDRISQFGAAPPTPRQSGAGRPSWSPPEKEPKEEEPPTEEPLSPVANSPFRKNERANRLPSLPAPSTAPPSNPFAVTLRPTRPPQSQSPKDTIDRAHDSAGGPAGGPNNPFRVRLRPTGGGGGGGAANEALCEEPNEGAADRAASLAEPEPAAEEAPKKKMTWREKQDLLKQQQLKQQQQEEQEEQQEEEEPPQKDVASLIRERVAAARQNGGAPPSPSGAPSAAGGGAKEWQSSLKKTAREDSAAVHPPTKAPVEEAPKDTEADPRASLMAMLHHRGAAPVPSTNSSQPGPQTGAAAMLQKRVASQPDPRKALNAMLLAKQGAPAPPAPPPAAPPRAGAPAGAPAGRPALRHDPAYAKYFKMLKVGMPLPAVQHAMKRDGLDPSVMDGDHDAPAPSADGGGEDGVPLREDPAYAKYFKMLKLGLPLGAVKNALERDGLDPAILDLDPNAPLPKTGASAAGASHSSSNAKREKAPPKDTHRRTRLHWDTAGVAIKANSVWAMVDADDSLDALEIDEGEFANLFQAELSATAGSGAGAGGSRGNNGGGKKGVVQVIDPKRANNGGIILARLRMSYDDMARAVERIDETAMSSNQAQGIVEYMPTASERRALRAHMTGDGAGGTGNGNESSAAQFEKLCECEKFMVAMMTVAQSRKKLRALLFKLQFRGCIHDLAHDVFSIEKACDELSHSVRLRKLFGIVLNIGNRLNTAGPGQKRKAGAFTVRSLLKLNQAKAFDNKTTFLHYVVLVVRRNSEALLDFKDDLPTVPKATKTYWDQCVGELEEVETQLENVRKLALHEARAGQIVYQLPPKKAGAGPEDRDSDDLSVESMSLEDEVALLRSTKIGMFALSAIRKVSQLRERVDAAKGKFAGLLEYFGESGDSRMQPHELFEIIATFCRNFDVARADVERMEKAKKRDEKKEKDEGKTDKPKSIQSPSPAKKGPPLPRASSLQPNMGNVLSDLKRATAGGQLPPLKPGTASPTKGSGPVKVTPRYPDDESSGIGSIVSDASPRASPTLVLNQAAEARAAAEEDEKARARAQAEAAAAARGARKAQERQRAEEAATKAQERQRAEEERRRAEDAAAAKEAARKATEQKQLAEEAAWRAREERRLADEAAAREEAAQRAIDEEERRRAEKAATAARQQQYAEEAARSNESEADGPTGRAGDHAAHSPPHRRTRREMMSARRERARNRHFGSASPTKSAPPATRASEPPPPPPPPSAAAPAPRREERAPQPPPDNGGPKPAAPSSNAGARASARDRYARHKRIMQNRHSTSNASDDKPQPPKDTRTFTC